MLGDGRYTVRIRVTAGWETDPSPSDRGVLMVELKVGGTNPP